MTLIGQQPCSPLHSKLWCTVYSHTLLSEPALTLSAIWTTAAHPLDQTALCSLLTQLLIDADNCEWEHPKRAAVLEKLWPSHLDITVWFLWNSLQLLLLPIFLLLTDEPWEHDVAAQHISHSNSSHDEQSCLCNCQWPWSYPCQFKVWWTWTYWDNIGLRVNNHLNVHLIKIVH